MPFPRRCTTSLLLASCLGIISALAPLLAADPALTLKQTAIIVEQRGRVRGVGMLARYPAPGPQLIAVSRTTTALAGEAFTPICTVRVLDPTGRTVAWQELTDQPDGPLMARLKVPAGPAGIWRVSVSGGRGNDVIRFDLPATTAWGIRGEMNLGGVQGDWWMWVPRTVTRIIARAPSGLPDVSFRDRDGATLASADIDGKVTVLSGPPTGVAIQVRRATAKGAVAFDGIPGLWCPNREAAEDLQGGTAEVGGWMVAGPLQARVREWMVAAAGRSLAPGLVYPTKVPTNLANPIREAQLYGEYAPLSSLATALPLQVTEASDIELGAFSPVRPAVDWRSFLHGTSGSHFDASGLAAAVACTGPMNPAGNNEALRDRAALSAFRHLVGMQGDDLLRDGDLQATADPMTYAFFIYEGALANPLRLLASRLDAEGRAIWRDGLIAVGDKLGDHMGFQSNQFMHVIVGHLHTYEATGERRFLGYFERLASAFCTGAFGRASKFGQHPAGYFLEQFGPDGNYDGISGTLLAAAYNTYSDLPVANPLIVKQLRAALIANQHFKSHFWLPQPDGRLLCSTQFNCRQKAALCGESWPASAQARADFPLARRRWLLTQEGPGTFPGIQFPSVVNDDTWARRLLSKAIEKKDQLYKVKGVPAAWTADAWAAAGRRVTAAPASLPWEKEGISELPGLIAWKSGLLYGTVFYAVDGADPKQALMGTFGGGPTQLWTAATGVFAAGMRNGSATGEVKGPGDLTQACIAGTTVGNAFFHSGDERAAITWITPGRHFRISGAASAPLIDQITWDYKLGVGTVTIVATIASSGIGDAWVNVPIPVGAVEGPVEVSIANGTASITLAGRTIRIGVPAGTTIGTPIDAAPYRVRCLRLPMAAAGATLTVRFTVAVTAMLPALRSRTSCSAADPGAQGCNGSLA